MARLTKKKKKERLKYQKYQYQNNIKNKNGNLTNFTELKSIIKGYYEQMYTKQIGNLGEMNTLKQKNKYNLSRLNHGKYA